ncbi:MAG: hypothetical protein IT373_30635 [Polyangiaceae bacterium]|nr:hypothetical protein [Polyangiaceae bacterium]
MTNETTRMRVVLGALLVGLVAACGGTEETTGTGGGGTGATTSTGTTSSTTSTLDQDQDGDGFTPLDGDCDDLQPSIFPGAAEVCDDLVDNNCNGATDASEPDGDGDGFGPCAGDCDDGNPNVSPAAAEIPGDSVDNNCDGVVDADFDGDGYTAAQGDCDDADHDVHPGALETCFDGVDNDCNSFIDAAEPDQDGDGYGPCGGDCDDGNPNAYPGAAELAGNGIDDNCDNLVDEDVDADGWTVTNGDCDDADPTVNPAVLELCADNIDNDCDGTIDTDCITACDMAELLHTSVGCVYFAVDANNDPVEGYDAQPYAVVVSNVDAAAVANVQVQTRQGGVWTAIQNFAVPPGTLHQFDLPDRHVNYTNSLAAGAYRVVSDSPIIAYQFQPVNGQTSYTSDASLLLPTSALDRYYYVSGWGKPSYGNGQVMIVASEDNTVVSFTPSIATVAGGSIPALAAGTLYNFPAMQAGDFVQIESSTGAFAGSYITADKPVAVFSTHWCANIPTQGCCCDHLEEQMFGLQTWGSTYVGARLPVRSTGTPEATQWHVVASQANTQVTFSANAAVTGLPASQTMQPGQVLFFQTSGTMANPGDFFLSADKPIHLMEYLSSSYTTNAPVNQAGDPAMTQAVPVEQFLDHYIVLVPFNWIYDYLVLTKAAGETVSVDGTDVPQAQFVQVGAGPWEVARIATADGAHTLAGSAPFGVVLVGYDAYDSYAYPGGLNQQIINPIN